MGKVREGAVGVDGVPCEGVQDELATAHEEARGGGLVEQLAARWQAELAVAPPAAPPALHAALDANMTQRHRHRPPPTPTIHSHVNAAAAAAAAAAAKL